MSKAKKNEGFEALRYAIVVSEENYGSQRTWNTFFDKNLPLVIVEANERWR